MVSIYGDTRTDVSSSPLATLERALQRCIIHPSLPMFSTSRGLSLFWALKLNDDKQSNLAGDPAK